MESSVASGIEILADPMVVEATLVAAGIWLSAPCRRLQHGTRPIVQRHRGGAISRMRARDLSEDDGGTAIEGGGGASRNRT